MPNTAKRNHFKATVIAAAIAVLPLTTHAAGLGKITVLSALGQPLKAELEVTASREEATSLVAKLAAAEAFRQAGIEYTPVLSTLRFSRDIKERGGRRYLEISTDRPLNEPFIDMLVELSWASGRLVREYTFLLDPPELAAKAVPVPVAAPEARAVAPMVKPTEKAAPAPVEAKSVGESQAPARSAAATSAKPAAGATREVVAGDTLGKIAAQTVPQGVSLDQMLVALFRNNRDAFIGDNMNRLKAGKILSIPDAETAGQVSAGEARKEIVAQAADFNAYRQRLASVAAAEPARDQAAKQSVSGKIAPKVEDKAPVATGKDKLEVSRTEAARDAKGKPLQGRIAALEEDLVTRDRALKEASSRIVELEKNLTDLKKLAELKTQAGADLQKSAQAAKPAAPEAKKPDTPAPAPAVAAKPVDVAKPAEAPKPAEAAKPAEPPKPAEAAKPADAAVAAKPAETPKPPPKKVVPPPPPEPEPDFIEENAPLVFGGGALLAALFGWLGFSAYRKKKAAASSANALVAEADLSAHSVFSTTSVAPPPSEQEASQFSTTGVGMVASNETVDPVVEADTFLAFGREAQAEEILLEALKTEPNRQAIHLKLLDIYSAQKNAGRFGEVAQDMHALTGGSGDAWEKVATMGIAIDPENPLYSSAKPVDHDATVVREPSMESTTVLRGPVPEIEPVPMASAPVAEVADAAVVDFDLDIGTAPAADASAAVAAPDIGAGLDFDLDLGTSEAAPAAAVAPVEAKSDDVVLDIDFDMPTPVAAPSAIDFPLETAQAAAVPETPVAAADSGSIDFEFDLGSGGGAITAPAPELTLDVPLAPAVAEPQPLDLGGISLDLDAPAAASAGADVPDNPEVATKLELAAAYAEMGDRDGARELFQEAIAEGSPAQQQVARAKLDSLG
ncbi:MAG: pilus assembly protein [Sterolibacteriaceae bacterium]|nr:pilus assembly protein [Sterolibacteriaceae bacterium]